MNKAQFIDAIATKANITKKEANEVFDAMKDTIIESLVEGEKVTITGFGSFEVKHRNPRICRNPQTGDKIEVPAKSIPCFKAGSSLKDAIKD